MSSNFASPVLADEIDSEEDARTKCQSENKMENASDQSAQLYDQNIIEALTKGVCGMWTPHINKLEQALTEILCV